MIPFLLGCSPPAVDADPAELAVDLVEIDAGSFSMGHPKEDHGAYGQEWKENEIPPHMVSFSAFAVQRDEVSVAQWALFLDAMVDQPTALDHHVHPLQPVAWDGAGFGVDADDKERPVNFVSWHDAAAWCAWADMRLPTEAEWERVAKGGDDPARRYPWAEDDIDCTRAVYFTGTTRCEDAPGTRGSRSPSGDTPDGVRDLAGNVAEWTADVYGPYTGDDQVDPTGVSSGPYRAVRGGGYREGGDSVRTMARFGAPAEARSEGVGFRCVVSR